MWVSIIQNHVVETDSKGFCAILIPVVINIYTQVTSVKESPFSHFSSPRLTNPVSTTLSSRKTLVLRRPKITFPIKVKPEVGFHDPWRPGRTEHTFVCCARMSTQSPKNENDRRHHAILQATKGRISQLGHQQSFHHFLSLQFLPERLRAGCQRNRLPCGVDGLHCGDGLCQRPQGRCWNQRGRLARTAL